MSGLGRTEGCSVFRAVPRTQGKELEEELASRCVDWPLEGDGEPRAGNVGLHGDPKKPPDSCSSLSGPVTGEGLAVMLMGLWGRGRIRAPGVMLGVGSKGSF